MMLYSYCSYSYLKVPCVTKTTTEKGKNKGNNSILQNKGNNPIWEHSTKNILFSQSAQ